MKVSALAIAKTVDGENVAIPLSPSRILYETQYVLYGFKSVQIEQDCIVTEIVVNGDSADCYYELGKGDTFEAGAKFFPASLKAQCGKTVTTASPVDEARDLGESLIRHLGEKLEIPIEEVEEILSQGIEESVEDAIREAKEEKENYETS